MKSKILISLLSLSFSMTSFGQKTASNSEITVPKAEIAFGYSFINVHPNLSPITSYNINGGGAGFVFNATPLFGIKAEFMDYTGGGGAQLRAHGYNGNVSGNPFTYLFGPQIKKHSGRFQPFGEALFGAGHSGAYASIYNSIHGVVGAGNSNNAFAMSWVADWTFL